MRSIFTTIVIIITLSLFSGCASKSLSVEDMQKEIGNFKLPHKVEENRAIVYIIRPNVLGGFVRFNIFLDSKKDSSEIGYTRANQYIYFNVESGKHTIYSKAENWASKEIDVKENDIIFIYQDPSIGILYARNKLFIVDEIEGTYHLKNLKLGTINEKN